MQVQVYAPEYTGLLDQQFLRNDMGVGAIILNEAVPDLPSRSKALPHSGGKNIFAWV